MVVVVKVPLPHAAPVPTINPLAPVCRHCPVEIEDIVRLEVVAFPKKAFVDETRDVAVRVVPVAEVNERFVEVTPANCGDDVAHKFCDNPNVTTPGEEVEIVTLFAGIKV